VFPENDVAAVTDWFNSGQKLCFPNAGIDSLYGGLGLQAANLYPMAGWTNSRIADTDDNEVVCRRALDAKRLWVTRGNIASGARMALGCIATAVDLSNILILDGGGGGGDTEVPLNQSVLDATLRCLEGLSSSIHVSAHLASKLDPTVVE